MEVLIAEADNFFFRLSIFLIVVFLYLRWGVGGEAKR